MGQLGGKLKHLHSLVRGVIHHYILVIEFLGAVSGDDVCCNRLGVYDVFDRLYSNLYETGPIF